MMETPRPSLEDPKTLLYPTIIHTLHVVLQYIAFHILSSVGNIPPTRHGVPADHSPYAVTFGLSQEEK